MMPMTSSSIKNCGLKRTLQNIERILCDKSYRIIPFSVFLMIILSFELILGILIINNVKYTEIDWNAYMQEVSGFLKGERDYMKLHGDTGPLVYPAGFVYIYSLLYYVTNHGVNIRIAQYLFLGIYLLFIYLILNIYRKSMRIPPWVLILVCISRRIHSIFMLRLFNDGIAMLFLYIAIICFIYDRWSIGCIYYSIGVSVKMNVLLFAPALLILLLQRFGGWKTTLYYLILCAIPQFLLGLPFLLTYPWSYVRRSFELGRQFMYKWTVNWKCIPEHIFLSSYLSKSLLIFHVIYLLFFANYHWCRNDGGIIPLLKRWNHSIRQQLSASHIILSMFTCQFIGVIFCRSLHFQFYTWYFHTLPYLLWQTSIPIIFKITLLALIEWVWNVYPANSTTSTILHFAHIVLLVALWFTNNDDRITNASSSSSKANNSNQIRSKHQKLP